MSMLMLANGDSIGQENFIEKLKPDHIKIQYAGGIGFFSLGTGYQNRQHNLEGDLYYGYLPKSIGGVRIHSLSAKFFWIPFHLTGKKIALAEPLITGILVNYNFGKQYFINEPSYFPDHYYNFPTAINSAVLFGSRIGFNKPKKLAVYIEVLSFDRDLASFFSNTQSLRFTELFTAAFGLKFNLK